MSATAVVLIVVLLALIGLGLAIRIVKQYEKLRHEVARSE